MSEPASSKRLEIIDKTIAAGGGKDPFPYYARAMELRSLGRKDDALAAFTLLEERFASYVPTYLMAAQVCHEQGRIDEARRWAERGAERAKAAGDDHALSELGSFLSTLG